MDPLVERARNGDAEALEEVLSRVAPSIQRFGLRMCKNPTDADDVLQDTLLAIATHLPEFEGRSSLTSWVFTLVRSACTRRRRGAKNQPHLDADAIERADMAPTPEESASDRELARALDRALASLSDEHREVILLRDVEGLDAKEAADAIGISVDALKSRLHRARAALRSALAPQERPREGCPDIVAAWSKKLEGDLDAHDCAAMEKHIETCATCASACDALKNALLACRRSSSVVRPEVQARVKAAVRAWLKR